MKLLRMTVVLVGLAAFAQQGPSTANTLQFEAAWLFGAKAQALDPREAPDARTQDDVQRIHSLAAALENMRRDMERRQVSMPLRTTLELRLHRQREEQEAVIRTPAAFAVEDGISFNTPRRAESKLLMLDQLGKQLEYTATINAALSAGRTVAAIDTAGLSVARQSELLSRLPVSVGEMLSFASVELLSATVKRFDPELAVTILLTENGGARIAISASDR